MNLHEYQAKQLFARYGIRTPRGEVTDSPRTAGEIFSRLNISKGVVKSQIHSGGRGQAGGIKLVTTAEEAEKASRELIGKILITHQTGPAGKTVRKVLVEESLSYDKELYLGMVIDRKEACPVMMVSAEGGMEIEELARKSSEKILKFRIYPAPTLEEKQKTGEQGDLFSLPQSRCGMNPHLGLQPYQANEIVSGLGLNRLQEKCKADLIKSGTELFLAFSKLFIENDCSLAEINPLVVNSELGLIALDGKINLDDRGLFRHKDLMSWRDIKEEDPLEYEASKFNLSYIGLDGNIGCMVNGAGLAMATMDLIKLHGGNPANFLDVGGGASRAEVTNAFKLLLANKNVKAILVNIFGGIMKCDVIAEGLTQAAKEVGLKLPLVVRLEGTNVEIGKKILKDSKLNIISADTMDEAAKKVVALAK